MFACVCMGRKLFLLQFCCCCSCSCCCRFHWLQLWHRRPCGYTKPCETNFVSVLTPRHIAKWKHGRLYHCEPRAHIQRILRINLITTQTADEVCHNQMQHPHRNKLEKYVETYETRYAWAQHIRTIRNGRARLTHIKNIILIRNIRKTRNISNHEKHNIIIRNIRNANTMNDTLGFSSIATTHIQKHKGLMPIYTYASSLSHLSS